MSICHTHRTTMSNAERLDLDTSIPYLPVTVPDRPYTRVAEAAAILATAAVEALEMNPECAAEHLHLRMEFASALLLGECVDGSAAA